MEIELAQQEHHHRGHQYDQRLRERDLLATDEFAEAFFVADRFAFDGTRLREGGALEDVAPTILGILGLEKPAEMTGRDLRLNI